MTQWVSESGEEWGPWVIHDGMGCPLMAGVIVDVVSQDRFGYTMRTVTTVIGGSYSSWDWTYYPELKKIIRYREKKPKGLKMLEEDLWERIEPVNKKKTRATKAPIERV